MGLIQWICLLLRAFLKPRLSLAAENLAESELTRGESRAILP